VAGVSSRIKKERGREKLYRPAATQRIPVGLHKWAWTALFLDGVDSMFVAE
jgi:hypothetical protein